MKKTCTPKKKGKKTSFDLHVYRLFTEVEFACGGNLPGCKYTPLATETEVNNRCFMEDVSKR